MLCLSALISCLFGRAVADDAGIEAVQRYMQAVAALKKDGEPTLEQRKSHREEWLAIFMQVIQEAPPSPGTTAAIQKAIGLSNSLGKADVAQSLIEKRIGLCKSEADKLFWSSQLLEAARAGGDESEIKLAASVLRTNLKAIDPAKVRLDGDGFLNDYVNGMLSLANEEVRKGDDLNDAKDRLLQAETIAENGFGGLVGPEGKSFGISTSISQSLLAIAEKSKDEGLALESLLKLDKSVSSGSSSAGERAILFASMRFQTDLAGELAFLEKLLSSGFASQGKSLVRLRIGEILLKQAKYVDALQILQEIENDDGLTCLARLSAASISGGHGAELGAYWYTRGLAHIELGQPALAEDALKALTEIEPGASRPNSLATRIDMTKPRTNGALPVGGITVIQKLFLIGNLSVLLAVVAYSVARYRRGNGESVG